jgi:restriction system protein
LGSRWLLELGEPRPSDENSDRHTNWSSGAIRDFFGSLDRKGLFVTTSTFSASATETAQYLSKRIVLIDGEQLAKLMIRHNVACRVEDTLQIKKIDEDFFE